MGSASVNPWVLGSVFLKVEKPLGFWPFEGRAPAELGVRHRTALRLDAQSGEGSGADRPESIEGNETYMSISDTATTCDQSSTGTGGSVESDDQFSLGTVVKMTLAQSGLIGS